MTKRSELSVAGIYRITCIASGKVYIGQAINVRRRWESHRHYVRKGEHRNPYLQRVFNKHGMVGFTFEIIEKAPEGCDLPTWLNEAEWRQLAAHPSNFNLMEIGEPTVRASAETRAKLSAKSKERWADPEYKERIRQAQRHRHSDPEWSAARAASLSEAHSTPERRAARSMQSLEMWEDPAHRETQSAKRKTNWQDPEYRAQQSASRKASHADPESKARRSAALKAAWIRRKEKALAD